MADVTLKGIRKNYDPGNEKDVLRDIDLDIEEGELVVFVGPSGCGKSTLPRLIAGLDDITDGELHIGGKLMNQVPPVDRGAESYVYMDVGGKDFTVRVRPETPATAGRQFEIGVPADACYLFDEAGIAFPRTARFNRG